MIKFFRKIRQRLLSENKFGKYLLYAIGEIVLVVIGILIAIQINNRNELRKSQDEVLDIYNQIVFELNNDISELSNNLEYYENLEPIFDKVFSDSRSVDLLDDGLSRLMVRSVKTNFDKAGIERLKSVSAKDSLSLRLIELYDATDNITEIEDAIAAECTLLAEIFRDSYSWYPEWMSKPINKDNSSAELQDYFVNSLEYRNFVISSHQKIYNNYVPGIKIAISELEKIREKLKIKTLE